jgi:acid phosphatase
MPMGGRIIVERMSCKELGFLGTVTEESFVRININDGIIAVPHCNNGPGHSCPLENFLGIIEQKVAKAGNFKQKCGLPDGSKEGITFLHQ